jgi:hypothetical protein
MARKKGAKDSRGGNAKKAAAAAHNGAGSGSVAGYFRELFKKTPRLLGERSNQKLLDQWLTDHPEHAEVPHSVKANLANVKSVLRSKKRKRVAGRARAQVGAAGHERASGDQSTSIRNLEGLELEIDECLTMARGLDRDGLRDVIALLRRARNAVVWKIGQ